MSREEISILSGTAHPELAKAIAGHLGQECCRATIGRFPDGEVDVKIHRDVSVTLPVYVVRPGEEPTRGGEEEVVDASAGEHFDPEAAVETPVEPAYVEPELEPEAAAE